MPSSATAPCFVFTPTLKALETLLARISDFTLVVIQLSDITRSALLAATLGVMDVSSAALAETALPSKVAASNAADTIEIVLLVVVIRLAFIKVFIRMASVVEHCLLCPRF